MSGFHVPAGDQTLTLEQVLELRQTALMAAVRTDDEYGAEKHLAMADKFLAWLLDGEL